MRNHGRTILLWAFIALLVLMAFVVAGNQEQQQAIKLPYSVLLEKIENNEVESLTIQGEEITGVLKDNRTLEANGPDPASQEFFLRSLAETDIDYNYEPKPEQSWFVVLLLNSLPILLILLFFIFMMRQLQGGGGKAMSFGKSKAKLLSETGRRMTFEDVAGADEAKEELEEIIHFLKDPRKFTRLGGRIPKGVLLMGPPGTGKTLLARAVAGEAGVPFFSISGSDFVEMFVGVGASRVRDLFEQGKKNAPCIVFIDEIDAVGRHRGAGLGGGHDEREQTLNQLLVEMDGFESNEGVIIVAATNRPDVLDPALLRPGRFDRRIIVSAPDFKGRLGILKVHTRRTPLGEDVDLETLAKGAVGFNGAQLENLVNEAALMAARFDKEKIDMGDFEAAKDKVIMGPERRSMAVGEEDRRRTAYHEAGHALVAAVLPGSDKVHKVTITPRGRAMGLTWYLPEERFGHTKEEFRARIAMAMGGRAAEEVVLSEFSTGASNDLKQATRLAHGMVCKYGMSDKLGPVSLTSEDDEVFLGRSFGRKANHSEETARAIDEEVRFLVTEGYSWAKTILVTNIHILHKVAQLLLEKETVDGSEFKTIVDAMDPVLPEGVGAVA
ncbi:MAG: ATP-dependent zinc metalloprotease FtsH [Myxococcota bacterium]|nr:ATP-dependent zinc metalloprotease FtsH [Myxococcota bacterium]